jgi:hypothetical protein
MTSCKPLVAIAIAGLCNACSPFAPTANVPTSYAKLDTGYLNSGIYDLGWVFAWHRSDQVLRRVGPLVVPKSLKDQGVRVGKQKTALSADTEVEFSGDLSKLGQATASLKATVARNTTTQLDNVVRETVSSDELLNYDNISTRAWRRRVARDFPSDEYRFLVIDGVMRGDKVTVGLKHTRETSAEANVINIGKAKLKVKYSGENTYTQSGTDVPLVVQARLFRLTTTDEDPQFVPVSAREAKEFNFQEAIKHLAE